MSNFLYLLTALSLTFSLTGCQTLKGRSPKAPIPPSSTGETAETPEEAGLPPAEESVVERRAPRVGLILGAGGVKAFAHIGVLKAFEEAHIPVHAIVGLEWGALVGTLYAANGSANDLEWQLFKLNPGDIYDIGLLGTSKEIQSSQKIKPFLQKTLGSAQIDGLRVQMSCPTRSLSNEALYWMSRGSAASVVRLCMSYPPFFKPTQGRYAAVDSVAEAAERLRSQGAELIVFINVLEAGPLFTPKSAGYTDRDVILWSAVRKDYKRAKDVVDEVIGVYIEEVGVNDFDSRRKVVGQVQSAATEVARRLVEKYGF